VLAVCGTKKVWHWRHKAKLNCDHWWENETQWHRDWKNLFPEEWQEVVHFAEDGEKHIADVKTNKGMVIEFQHSAIHRPEVESRCDFYKHMIWIVDASKNKRLREALPPFSDIWESDNYNDQFDYSRNRDDTWGSLKVPVFFDLGINNWLVGQVPQREADNGFYKTHYLKKDYLIRAVSGSGKYTTCTMKPPKEINHGYGYVRWSAPLYDFLKLGID
jgi:hypothetical protein